VRPCSFYFSCSHETIDAYLSPHLLLLFTDFSVYAPDLEVVDPSGVKIHGVKNYKNAFRLVHTVVNLFYCPERSLLTFRLVYDWARNEIRVSWNAEVVPKAIFGGTNTLVSARGLRTFGTKFYAVRSWSCDGAAHATPPKAISYKSASP